MAGLLDALFDPSLYSGNGGLLARIAPSLGAIQPSQGFDPSFSQRFDALPTASVPEQATPMQIGGYQMPRVGSEMQYASIPSNATPTQGQMPQQAAQPAFTPSFGNNGAGFFDRLNAGLQSIGNGGSVIGAITGNRTDPQSIAQQQQGQLFQAYRGSGLSPSQAFIATVQPKLAENLMGGGLTDDIKEYQFARREDPSLTFAKFMLQKKANQGEYSLNPVYGTNDKGETVLMQTGKNGEAIQTKLPPGVKVSSGIEKVDLGTHWALYDKKSGVPLGTQPKDLQGKEAAEERGSAQGKAQAALANGADLDAEATKKKIDEFISHKGFNEVFGQLDQFRPSWTHSNEGADALARYKQLKGVAFLSAYQMLKGGGAITDIEGQKAGEAMARLDRAQSEDEAKQALRDFKGAVDIGLQKLKRAAGGGSTAPAAPQRIRINADGTLAQ